jgi:hypothetical protein
MAIIGARKTENSVLQKIMMSLIVNVVRNEDVSSIQVSRLMLKRDLVSYYCPLT